MAGEIKEIKTRLSLDGSTKFAAELKSVDSQLKVLAAETRAVAATFDKASATQANYLSLNQALSRQIEQQKIKVNALKTAVLDQASALEESRKKAASLATQENATDKDRKNAQKSIEGNERQLQKYQTQLANAEAALNKLTLQYRNNEAEAEKLKQANNGLASSYSKFKIANIVEQAKSLGKELLSLSAKQKTLVGAAVIGTATAKAGFEAIKIAVDAVSKSLAAISTATITALSAEVKLAEQAFVSYEKVANKALESVVKSTTNMASSFQFEMSKVQAYSNLDKLSTEFKMLEDAALQAGSVTSKTATESAQALGYMALAGWDYQRQIESLLPIIHAAEAGNLDLALSSQLITKSMANLGLEADRLPEYLDKLTATQNNSNTSMQELLEAYVACGGMLKSLKIPMTEYMTLMGRMADQGRSGAEAGHSFNSILINLIGANKNARTALTDLGVSAWDDNGKFIGLTNTLIILKDALSAVSDEEKLKFEAKIGGKLQFETLTKLLDGIDERYDILFEKVENSNGLLEDTTETMLDNFKGTVTILNSALEGLGIDVGSTLFLEEFSKLAETLTRYVNNLKTAFDEGGTEHYITKYFDYLEGAITRDITKIIPKLESFYSQYREFFDKMSETVFDIGINLAPDVFDSFIPIITTSFSRITMTIAQRSGEILPELLTSGAELVKGIVQGMSSALLAVSSQLPTIVDEVIGDLSGTLASGLQWFIGSNLMIAENILKAIQTMIDNEDLVATLSDFIDNVLGNINKTFPKLTEMATKIINTLVNGISSKLPAAGNTLQTMIKSLLESFTSIIENLGANSTEIADFAVGLVMAIINSLTENLPVIMGAAQLIIDALGKGLIDHMQEISDFAVEVLLALVEFISNNIGLVIDLALTLIETLATALTSPHALDRLIFAAFRIVEELVEQIMAHLPLLLMAAIAIVTNLVTMLLRPEFLEAILIGAGRIIKVLFSGLNDGANRADEFVQTLAKKIGEFISQTDWSKFGEDIMSGIFGIDWSTREWADNFWGNWRSGFNSIVSGKDKKEIQDNAQKSANEMVDAYQNALDINSPSKVMEEEVGIYIIPGLIKGIDDTTAELQNATDQMFKTIDISNRFDEYGYTPYIGFSTNLDDIQSQIDGLSSDYNATAYWGDMSDGDFNRMMSQSYTLKNDTSEITSRLDRIEEMLMNANLTITTTNYLYPNSHQLASTVSEAMLFQNAVTGGR